MGIVYKKNDTWYIRFDAPRGFDGKRKQIAKSCKGMTKRQAEQHLREIESAIVRGEYQQPVGQTMAEFLAEWLSHAHASLEESTFVHYRMLVRAHIIPELGRMRLDQLTPLVIQRFYRKLQEPGSNRRDKNKGLGSKAIKNIHGILHRALVMAVRWGLLTRNPADAVDTPKMTRSRVSAASPDELQQILEVVESAGEWRIPLLIAIGTGMRRGEVLALQWQDYDPTAKTLLVQRSRTQIDTYNVVLKGTKTDRTRVVLVNDSLAAELDRQRIQTSFNKPTDWICCDAEGKPFIPKHLTRALESIVKSLGITVTLHGLRHSHATTLIAAGVPVKTVSERLGHSTVVITQDIYTHVLPHMQRQAADAIEKLWKPKGNATDGEPPPDRVSEIALCTYCAPETKIPAQNAILNGNFA